MLEEKELKKDLKEIKEEISKLRALVISGIVNGSKKEEDNEWIPAIGPNALLPNEFDNRYCLVKIRALGKDLRPFGPIYELPHIAEFRGTAKWYTQETNEKYETKWCPYQVVYWKPIPF